MGLSDGEVVLSFERSGQVRMKLLGANPQAAAEASEPLPGRSHYFLGRDPSRWRTNVEQFARVSFSAVYPGIGAAFYGSQGHLEYDFEVAPGADPNRIAIEFSGASARLSEDGDVVLPVGDGEARLRAPVIYQRIGGKRRAVQGRHRVQGNRLLRIPVRARARWTF